MCRGTSTSSPLRSKVATLFSHRFHIGNLKSFARRTEGCTAVSKKRCVPCLEGVGLLEIKRSPDVLGFVGHLHGG